VYHCPTLLSAEKGKTQWNSSHKSSPFIQQNSIFLSVSPDYSFLLL
jgi:hypothetical protein